MRQHHDDRGDQTTVVFTCAVVLSALLGTSLASSAQQQYVAISDSRPLAGAITEIENRFGIAVSYEDPAYEHSVDIEDVTTTVRRDGDLSRRVLIPRRGTFTFVYDIDSATLPSHRALLTKLVSDYHASENAGMFDLVEGAGGFHVIPAGVRRSDGVIIQHKSPLGTLVSIPVKRRTIAETIEIVLAAAHEQSGAILVEGVTPSQWLSTIDYEDGARAEPARDVLARALAASGVTLSWQLFYDPGFKMYALNIHRVPSTAR